jgi:hypothetical protein
MCDTPVCFHGTCWHDYSQHTLLASQLVSSSCCTAVQWRDAVAGCPMVNQGDPCEEFSRHFEFDSVCGTKADTS